MLQLYRSKKRRRRHVLFGCAKALVALLCLWLSACLSNGQKIDLINPDSGLLGFKLGTSRESIPAQAEKLPLKFVETRILREEPEDLLTDFYIGKVWGREALVSVSARGVRIRNIIVRYNQLHQGEEFADAIRASLSAALGEPESSTRNVVGRRPDYVYLHYTTWSYGDISVFLSTHAPDDKKNVTDISLNYFLTTIR